MMRQKKLKQRLPGLSRWTIDRLDRDAGMARIEKVPMLRIKQNVKHLEKIALKGTEPELDELEYWDVQARTIERLPISRLYKKLGLREDERETLSENMVFWVLDPDIRKKEPVVYHSTRSARSLSKTLYRQVTGRRGS
jgi:predicted metalloprotease